MFILYINIYQVSNHQLKIILYWKYSYTTHITISNYFEDNYKLIMLCRDFTK